MSQSSQQPVPSFPRMNDMSRYRLAFYPPQIEESLHQLCMEVCTGKTAPGLKFFSLFFTNNYGVGLFDYYTTFEAFSNTVVTINFPNLSKYNFARFIFEMPFSRFSTQTDQMAVARSAPVAGRLQMEAAYIQHLFMKFDQFDNQQAEELKIAFPELKTNDDIRIRIKQYLKTALDQRLTQEAEVYWQEKAAKHPELDLDIARLDGQWEVPDSLDVSSDEESEEGDGLQDAMEGMEIEVDEVGKELGGEMKQLGIEDDDEMATPEEAMKGFIASRR